LQSSGAKRMRAVFSGRSSKRSWSATSTAATRGAGLPGSGVLTAPRSSSCYFPAAPAVFARHATPNALRSVNFHPHLHFLATEGGVDEAAFRLYS